MFQRTRVAHWTDRVGCLRHDHALSERHHAGLVLLALLGAFALRASCFGLLAPRLTSTAIAVLASATIVIGWVLGYQGYGGHLHKYNPELDAALVKALSF
jgi:hypothetical protein